MESHEILRSQKSANPVLLQCITVCMSSVALVKVTQGSDGLEKSLSFRGSLFEMSLSLINSSNP